MAEPPEKLAYSTTEAAELIGISRTSLYELIRTGRVRPTRLGRRVVIAHAELVRLLEESAG
jgi:excisionase family DNA binding protein